MKKNNFEFFSQVYDIAFTEICAELSFMNLSVFSDVFKKIMHGYWFYEIKNILINLLKIFINI